MGEREGCDMVKVKLEVRSQVLIAVKLNEMETSPSSSLALQPNLGFDLFSPPPPGISVLC
jgi:hypothetical protein